MIAIEICQSAMAYTSSLSGSKKYIVTMAKNVMSIQATTQKKLKGNPNING